MSQTIDTMRNSIKIALLMSMLFLSGIMRAQTAGSMISGSIFDDQGPLALVNVTEIDAANRIVAHAVANVNGEFSFKLQNVNDRIKVSYVGYQTQIIPIKSTTIKIRMKELTTLKDVVVTAKAKAEGSGLAIPQREVSGATQKIDASEFEGLGFTSIDEALQGRIAGLDIVMNSGNLGSGTSMRMRGAASINSSSEPLIVVDGNVLQTNTSGFDFTTANDEKFAQLLNVNPDDIQSITVLKDAASTAIWGSQGANGVIEIKIKRGSRGKTRVTYSYRLQGNYQPAGMKMMNGDQYTMLLKEEYFNPQLNDAASNITELNYDPTFSEYQMFNDNTDWVAAVKQIGLTHGHNLSLSGGGEKANYRISAGYDKQFGSIIAQSLDRFTTRVSLDYFVSDRIKIITNFNMTYTNNNKNNGDLLALAYKKMPNMSIYEQDVNGNSTGEYYQMLTTASSQLKDQKDIVNPIALAYEATNVTSTINIQPEFQLKYNFLGMSNDETELTYDGRVMFNVNNDYSNSFYPSSLVTSGWNSKTYNLKSSSSNKSQNASTTHTLTFVPKFNNPAHTFMMMVRGQLNASTSNSQTNSVYGLPIPSTNLPGTIKDFGTGVSQGRSLYFTSSAHYAYQGKYILDFTSRLDATTKFGPNRRWGFFPALSLRWNISDEEFMKKQTIFSMLSIRPSWGLVGNQPGSEYLFYSRYNSGASYNGEASISPSNIRLSNLKWEQVEKWNVGFDYGLFEDRLSGDVNLYTGNTTDLLMNKPALPSSSGYSLLSVQNSGSMNNTGWEFNMQTNKLIRAGKFSGDINVTFANNRNTITSMDETILNSLNGEFSRSNGTYLSRVQLNNALGSIYGFKYKGVYQYSNYSEDEVQGVSGPDAPVVKNEKGDVILLKNGKPKPMYFAYGTSSAYKFVGGDANYQDINHDGNINELDIVYLGSSLPKITGGFGFRFNYGHWSMNNQFNFRAGNKVINKGRMDAENMYSNNNQCMSVAWRWRVEGDKTSIPRALYNYGYNYLGSDRFVEDGSFLRLNYSQITYSFDPKLLKAYGITQLNFNISMNNIFILTKYSGNDPEVTYGGYSVSTDSNQTPRSKSFTAGLSISF
jgi:TonB-linked SusC/RagA family outer membrane protein